VLSRAISLAHIVFGPLVEQMLGLSLSDQAVLALFRDAAIDLLTRPLLNAAPADGSVLARELRIACASARAAA
jgi:hypothetical protein